MTNRTALAVALVPAVLLVACSGGTEGTAAPSAAPAGPTTVTTVTTTQATTTTTTTTSAAPAAPSIPGPYYPRTVRLSRSASVSLKPQYRVAEAVVTSVSGSAAGFEVTPGPGSEDIATSGGSVGGQLGGPQEFTDLRAGDRIAVNNMVLLVRGVHGGQVELTVGTRYR